MVFLRGSSRFRRSGAKPLIFVVTLVASAALLHCVGDDPTTTSPSADAGSDAQLANDSSTSDASADAGPSACAWDAPFDTPVPVPGIPTDGVEGHPSLSPNELTIYFHGFGARSATAAPVTISTSPRERR